MPRMTASAASVFRSSAIFAISCWMIFSAAEISFFLRATFSAAMASRDAMVESVTLGTLPASFATFVGTETSIRSRGRSGLEAMAFSTLSLLTTSWWADVATSTRSLPAIISVRRSMPTAVPPSSFASSRALSKVLLETKTVRGPLPARFLAMSPAMSPAPMIAMFFPSREPIFFSASSMEAYPTDTAPLFSSVSVLTFLPTTMALLNRE